MNEHEVVGVVGRIYGPSEGIFGFFVLLGNENVIKEGLLLQTETL